MIKFTYLISLISGYTALIASVVTISLLMLSVDESSGNAGSFTGFLSISLGWFGLMFSLTLGILSGSVAYVFPDKLPNNGIYKLRCPLVLLAPGLVFVLAVLWQSFISF